MIQAEIVQNDNGAFIMNFTLKVNGETHTIVRPCPQDFNDSINNFINGSSVKKRIITEFFKSSIELDGFRNRVSNIVKHTQEDSVKNARNRKRMVGILARHAQRAMLYGVYIEQKKQENRQHRFQKQLAKAKRFCYMLPFCVL